MENSLVERKDNDFLIFLIPETRLDGIPFSNRSLREDPTKHLDLNVYPKTFLNLFFWFSEKAIR
jgi:hypothetical protein